MNHRKYYNCATVTNIDFTSANILHHKQFLNIQIAIIRIKTRLSLTRRVS